MLNIHALYKPNIYAIVNNFNANIQTEPLDVLLILEHSPMCIL